MRFVAAGVGRGAGLDDGQTQAMPGPAGQAGDVASMEGLQQIVRVLALRAWGRGIGDGVGSATVFDAYD